LALASAALAVELSAWAWLAVLAVVAAWLGVVGFFRDPDRQPPAGDGLLLSPADGTISDITPVGPDSALGCEGVQVGVFMSVFDVHVNRAPCSGVIESIEHVPGSFLDVRQPAAWRRNESATITMSRAGGGEHRVIVRQVAGLIARRIVTDLATGQQVLAGQRIGMIKFGSRLEVLAPRELARDVRVRVGQKVLAGRTVILAAEQQDA